ncbi:lysophospholipid acyltransferase family protein [Devriesea agamarum]|uniref:lysophospholipid acyltransferase family protein n=1 Tax=Devriesea agamarum TaxID=472569 RepID=UPI00071D6220|nr:lysophospholipid acyltransferase family protein [Devriesea agamarum]
MVSTDRRMPWVIRIAALGLRPALVAISARHWSGQENLPSQGGAIVIGNHTSAFDPLAYGHLLVDSGIPPRFLAKDSLFSIPVLGTLLRRTGQIPVSRGRGRSQDALAAAESALCAGQVLTVYPEGTYTRDPGLWPMRARTGAARLALRTGAPLIPIACWGSHKVNPTRTCKLHLRPRGGIQIIVGPAIVATQRPHEDEYQAARRITDEAMNAVTAMLAQLRSQTPPDTVYDGRRDAHRPEVGRRLRRGLVRRRNKA